MPQMESNSTQGRVFEPGQSGQFISTRQTEDFKFIIQKVEQSFDPGHVHVLFSPQEWQWHLSLTHIFKQKMVDLLNSISKI